MVSVLLLAGFVLSAAARAQDQAPDTNRYNVLFIAVDDLRPELGCYGVDYVRTPNIDRLAAEGVLFRNHFVAVPTCGASRYALLTGRDPSSSGVRRGNNALYSGPAALLQQEQPGAQSMPELFRRSGYRTVLIGKLSHTADGRVFAYDGSGDGRPELPHAWDTLATPLGPWQRGWGVFFAYEGGAHREDGQGHRDLMQFTAEEDDDLPDGRMAAAAVEQLAALRDRGEPFFLGLGFFKPHLPFVATRSDWEHVQQWDVPPPTHAERAATAYWHNSGEFYGYHVPWEKARPLDEDAAMQARRAYLACVRYTDRQVGRVLDALEELGLAQDTVVVLWSDHGWFLGEGALWGKHAPLETALRSPLIVRVPDGAGPDGRPRYLNAGAATEALVATTDLYPTLIEICRPSFTQTQHPLDGLSLARVIAGSRPAVRGHVVSYWGNAVTVRTGRHRLVLRQDDESESTDVELFAVDVSATPGDASFDNIADEQPTVVERLKALLP